MGASAEQSRRTGDPEQPDRSRDPGRREEPKQPSSADTWPAAVLLPALLLLRFFGEQGWAYWTGAVIGVLGMAGVAVEGTAAVRHLLNGRRPWVAVWTLLALGSGSLVLVLRLAEHW
ncbi:hypothetical protein [Streptomyces marianii]|uniref:Uncharacterized protein n=1 Tax=Streptomyces marianii TaxID=1817406 RepID=A0A5R9E346_9ACTN|nr:hypothetical protein [Streptomyces marianii]TLQ44358.1 hypothetical protein FEF34_15600 [Streptomyces marianii]